MINMNASNINFKSSIVNNEYYDAAVNASRRILENPMLGSQNFTMSTVKAINCIKNDNKNDVYEFSAKGDRVTIKKNDEVIRTYKDDDRSIGKKMQGAIIELTHEVGIFSNKPLTKTEEKVDQLKTEILKANDQLRKEYVNILNQIA